MKYIKQYAIDIEVDDEDMTEDDIADVIEQSGLIVRGCMWKATWNVKDYDKGFAPIYSD